MSTTQPLQYAQIIADLQSLQNADPAASLSLLTSHHQLALPPNRALSLPQAPKFDRLGRRITSKKSLNRFSFTRTSSSTTSVNELIPSPSTSQPSTPGSAEGNGKEKDKGMQEDLDRAKMLMELYAQRSSLGVIGERGLGRAREKVEDVMREYADINLGVGVESFRGRI